MLCMWEPFGNSGIFGFLFFRLGFRSNLPPSEIYKRFIQRLIHLSTNEIGGNIMGYAVDYIPTSEQKRRKVKKKYRREHVTSKAIRAKDMKKAVKWNLPQLEYDTAGADTVDRSIAIRILHLDCISRDTDPDGDHAMQQLVSEGIVSKPKRVGGRQVFDRADLIQSLKAWTR